MIHRLTALILHSAAPAVALDVGIRAIGRVCHREIDVTFQVPVHLILVQHLGQELRRKGDQEGLEEDMGTTSTGR